MPITFDDMPLIEMSASTGFARNPLNRHAEMRPNDAFINERKSSDRARFVLFCGDRAVVDVSTNRPLEIRHDRQTATSFGADFVECAYLGDDDTGPLFASQVVKNEEEIAASGQYKSIDLRSLALQDAVGEGELGILAQARSMMHWHSTHRACARCGAKSVMTMGGWRRDCPDCGGLHFPRTDPVVIMLATRGDWCLMGRPPRLTQGVYTTLAGFMEPGETIEDAVRREIFEESGVEVRRVRYLMSQPWPFPASLMIGCHAEAVSEELIREEEELEDLRWFSREDVVKMMNNEHPEGLLIPPAISISYMLIKHYVDAG